MLGSGCWRGSSLKRLMLFTMHVSRAIEELWMQSGRGSPKRGVLGAWLPIAFEALFRRNPVLRLLCANAENLLPTCIRVSALLRL